MKNQYFELGERFFWKKEADDLSSAMSVHLQVIQEKHRNGNKQALIAQDIRSEKQYFVKILFCEDAEQIFVEKESKVQLYSPFIIRIYGGVLYEERKCFITLVEYIPEKDLSDLVREHGRKGALFEETRHIIALKFLYGIDHYMSLYRQDPIVHRDLKPENVVASADGAVVKIIDFDWVHLHDSSVTYMQRREQKGTPGYADPKYWNSYFCKKAMDIYSAGLVLYFLYEGQHHFRGNEEIQRYMVDPAYAYTLKEMHNAPIWFPPIIAKMIAREGERYEDIKDVIADIKTCLLAEKNMPQLGELLAKPEQESMIRLSYRVGDVKYSPYMRNYRFISIDYGRKQERSQNGQKSGQILSFYRMDEEIHYVILHEECHPLRVKAENVLHEGDLFVYAGTEIEILGMRTA